MGFTANSERQVRPFFCGVKAVYKHK